MKLINSDKIPGSLAPYSRGVIVKDIVFFSGQVGIQKDGSIAQGGIAEETKTIFANLEILLEEAGIHKNHICKMNVYIAKMDSEKFATFNKVYTNWIGAHRPCRTAIGVYSLPKGGNVEIEVIAEKP